MGVHVYLEIKKKSPAGAKSFSRILFIAFVVCNHLQMMRWFPNNAVGCEGDQMTSLWLLNHSCSAAVAQWYFLLLDFEGIGALENDARLSHRPGLRARGWQEFSSTFFLAER
jgi:hypothetical protein